MTSLSIINKLQNDKISGSLATASSWALVAALGYCSAMLLIQLLPSSSNNTAVTRSLTPNTPSTAPTASLARQIVDAHLFGDVASTPTRVAKPTPVAEAPKSRLNVQLTGIMATGDPKLGLALIGGGRLDKVVAVGEKIERATLEEVYARYIVINNGGKLERIELPKANTLQTASAAPRNTRTSNSRAPSTSSSSAPTPSSSGGIDVSQLPQTPGALRDYMVRNPATMQQLMDVRPFRKNGRVVGYKLNPKQDASLMRNFGIEPGDVVVALNGVKLDNQRRGLKALRQLVTAQQVDMTVLRNGAEIPVSISLQ